jgi:hypothetical protein
MDKKKTKEITDGALDPDPVAHVLMEETKRCQAEAAEAFKRLKVAFKKLMEYLKTKEPDPEIVSNFDEVLKKLDLMGELLAGGLGSA